MTFRRKMLLAQLPLALALAATGTLSAYAIRTLGEHSSRILRDNYRSVLAAQRMKEAAERIDSGALFILAGKPSEAGPQITSNLERFAAELRTQEGNITEPGEVAITRDLRGAWTSFVAELTRYRALRERSALQASYFGLLEPAFQRVKADADRLLALNQDAMLKKSDRAQRSAAQLMRLIVTAAVLIVVLGIWASAWLSGRILRPLGVLKQTVRRFDAGDLAVRARVASEDEVGALARDFNAMADRLERYRSSSLGDLLLAQRAAQATIDAFADPVVVLSAAGGVVNANASAAALGVDPESAAPLARAPAELRALLETLRGRVAGGHGSYRPAALDEALKVETPEGPRDLLPSAAPVYGEAGEGAGVAVVLSDVTSLLRTDQLKSDLVAFVAHELRTPLTSLQMAIHLCVEEAAGPLGEKQADLLHAARSDCERLQEIVNDVLDVSRLQEGRLELELVAAEPGELVRRAVEAGRELAAAHELRLHGEAMPDAPAVLADGGRIKIVFANLVGNAVRHSRAGGEITLSARRDGTAVRFEVRDEGPGIPLEHQAFVFEKFYRAPGALGGTGLGLYIAREIVRAHGGAIGVESEGSGATIWFTLPPAPASA